MVTTTTIATRGSMREMVLYFLRLGLLGFGGPVALVGQMERELVAEKGWLTKEQMREAIAICQSLPGPLAIQVGIYIAWLRCGFWGAWAGGWAFILPNFVIVATATAAAIAAPVAAPVAAQVMPVASSSTLTKLTLFFLNAGSLTFGSGLVIVPFLEQGLVPTSRASSRRLCGGDRHDPRRLLPARQDCDRRLAHGADRHRVAYGSLPLEGEQPAADRRHRRDRTDRLSAVATRVGDGEMRRIMRLAAVAFCVLLAAIGSAPAADPLELETKIPLGGVAGRIDHMAFDVGRGRLVVAELGNDSVGLVDIAARKVVHRIPGLRNPQGVGYVPALDLLLVANAGDGSVRLYRGPDYAAAGRIDFGDDADNIRVDPQSNRVYVGYGGGALAVIDPTALRKVADIPLAAHPESFQLDRQRNRIYVNLPDARAIGVAAPDTRQVTRWPMRIGSGNFPMALREDAQHVLAVFRHPARLGVFAMADGAQVAAPESCGDADDVFYDAERQRVYVSCGEGFIDVFDDNGYRRIAHIRTVAGARTALFVPEIDRLLLAVRANSGEPAAIWVFRPRP